VGLLPLGRVRFPYSSVPTDVSFAHVGHLQLWLRCCPTIAQRVAPPNH
jgi:hypothetical protein